MRSIKLFVRRLYCNHLLLTNFYATVDGLKLQLKRSGGAVIKNMFYIVWTHGNYDTNLFVYAPNSTIIACAINALGALHDSMIGEMGRIHGKSNKFYGISGEGVVADSAFCRLKHTFSLKSVQHNYFTASSPLYLLAQQENSMQ